ncbi:MerR family transcriptional regulator [Bacillus pinisoli]|uniref:MerR family transcriptional regulator n=1 Tax=Bacillus pinisoli TaxID=2901866 RepID=UPI001FF6E058|nr:helix-turn-helix domain-containing protein [Bacillus pinisoli]
MIKEHEEDILWDTVTILKEQNRLENALVLFKTLIERTLSIVRLPSKFLEEVKINLPSNEFVEQIRMLDKEIYQSIKSSNTTKTYELSVEFIETLSEIIPGTDRKGLIAKILAEQSKSHVGVMNTRYDLFQAFPKEQAEVYTSSEAAEMIGVSDQTIRRWCEQGKYPDAYQTQGGHWRIPKQYFKITSEEAMKRRAFEQELNEFNAQQGEVDEDEFL